MLPKLKILRDIKNPRGELKQTKFQIDLNRQRFYRIPLTKILRFGIIIFSVVYFIVGFAWAPAIPSQAADLSSSATSSQERTALENQLQQLEGQISQYQNKVQAYQKQGSSLKGEIGSLNNQIASLNLQIQVLNLSLSQLDQEISDTQDKITATQSSISNAQDGIKSLILYLYQSENQNLMEIFLSNPKLSDFFNDLANVALLQDNLRQMIIQVTNLQSQLESQQTELASAKSDVSSVQAYRASQKQSTESLKQEKSQLLTETQGQESKYQSLLTTTKENASQIRQRIFQLLGGGQLTFQDAYNYAKLAEGATGVRAALLLAVLDRESALGKNVGQCSYQQAMRPSEQTIFLQILQSLSINSDTVTVSCPNSDGAYGGAMGPAQFLPSTWMLYSPQIAKITGHSIPSPWNNADAFVATALYLKDAGAANASISQERIAAAKYYAGSRWRYYLWTYGQAVISRAEGFQSDIDVLNS
ncbi:MAG: lytic murein transglycosylase [Patescibacteria group bacterium]|nr:lytic murein transglycosylase [Patescibacteria group bacterium]